MDDPEDTLICRAAFAIRDRNIDLLKFLLETYPVITREEKEEMLSISVNSDSQTCFNYLYGKGISSYQLMQYCSNYKDFLRMEKIYKNHSICG